MFFTQASLPPFEAQQVSPRLLAHLGDAVFDLFERERELMSATTVSGLHKTITLRANAAAQADILDRIAERLTAEESDVVRRARNIKPQRQKRTDQGVYRKSTAFEALLGYLYLTDTDRLHQVLAMTLRELPKSSAGAP